MTTKSQWIALAERCEKATVADPQIDAEIVALLSDASVLPYPPATDFGPHDRWQFWSIDGKHFLGNERKFRVTPITASIDAITALIERELPGSDIIIRLVRNPSTNWPGKFSARIEPTGPCDLDIVCRAETQALALCAAFCRSMAEKAE
jgi:hypothetical protein